MAHRRERDRGSFRGTNIELMIVVAIIGIVAAIAIPYFIGRRADRGLKCLDLVLAQSVGAACPYSGKTYTAAACPDPAGHLDSNPRLERTEGGPRLQQTLPAYGGGPIEFGDGRTAVEPGADRATIRLTTGTLRRVFSIVLLCLFGLSALTLLGQAVASFWKKQRADGAGHAAGFLFCGAVSFFLVGSIGESTELVVERGHVTRVDSSFWRRGTPTVYAGCLGVVPVPSTKSERRRLLLVHTQAGALRSVPLETVAADRLDLADWLNRTLVPNR